MDALISTCGHHSRNTTFILFINSRLVECTALRRACEAVYAAVLPKGTRPFTYMTLDLPPHTVDVNVHPTKREVHFLHQDHIAEAVQVALEALLLSANKSIKFDVRNHNRLVYQLFGFYSNIFWVCIPSAAPRNDII